MYRGEQLTNERKNLKAIADSYENKISKISIPSRYWLSFALQKDTIQNSSDAKSNGDWEVEFKMTKFSKGHFLLIRDSGTTGLTGTIWNDKEALNRILMSESRKENLAYFLSSNYSAKGSESAGKRGRGKSLFLISSQDLCFYFDSLRISDNKHIAGAIYIADDNGTHIELETDDAVSYIKKKVGNEVKPLTEHGIRIFIKRPKTEVVEAIQNGMMLNFIERTWWEIIKKGGACIKVGNGQESRVARLSSWYDDEKIRTQKNLKAKEFPLLSLKDGSYRLKRIKLVYSPEGKIPDGIRGIAVQRRGMTIERRETSALVHEEGMNKVYGWVEMDKDLEGAMYDLEDVEHMGFNWIRNPARKMSELIKVKIREFAKEVKLIDNKLSKQRRIHRAVEEEVAKTINNFLKKSGFSRQGIGGKSKKKFKRSKTVPLRVSLAEFSTSGSKRVNFGEQIRAQSTAINELSIPLSLKHRTWIVGKNGETVKMQEEEIRLRSNSMFHQGWPELTIEEGKFERGDYSFRSKIVVLQDTEIELKKIGRVEKGLELQRTISFSVEKDPKSTGFLTFEAIEDESVSRYITTRPEPDSLVIEYNTEHPYIKELMPVEKREVLFQLLLQTGIIVAFNEVLAEDISREPALFKDFAQEFVRADGKIDPSFVLPTIMTKVGQFMASQ